MDMRVFETENIMSLWQNHACHTTNGAMTSSQRCVWEKNKTFSCFILKKKRRLKVLMGKKH